MKKKTYLLWKKILTRTLISFAVVALLYSYFHTGMFTITSYVITGIPSMYESELQQKLKILEKQPFYTIIPANKILTYHRVGIKTAITDALPNTKNITITPTSLHTLHISVTPYVPLFRIDAGHAVTETGYVYRELGNLDSYPLLTIASSTLATTTRDGILYTTLVVQNASSTEEILTKLSILVPRIHTVLFTVASTTVDQYGDIFLSDVRGKSVLRFSSSTDIDKAWSTLISAVDTEPLKTLLITKKMNLEYIDTRYGNKVFYKFTNTKIPTIINASTTVPYDATATTTTTLH